MITRLLVIQSIICTFWMLFLFHGLDPITLPLVAALAIWPLVGVIVSARVPLIRIIPIIVLGVVGYVSWLMGWQPNGASFPFVSGLVFFLAWNGCTQVPSETKMKTVWLGAVLYAPLFIMSLASYLNFTSPWPAGIGLTMQLAALVYVVRTKWDFSVSFTPVTVLRINSLAMLILPVIFAADPLAIYGQHEHVLGIGTAISAIVMTRQQLLFRRRIMKANYELETFTAKDQLTGLYTWTGLLQELHERPHQQWTLVCFDIDDFAHINSTFGFDTGDRLIRHIANRLHLSFPTGVHGRVGGDYFITAFPTEIIDETKHLGIVNQFGDNFDPPITFSVTGGIASPGFPEELDHRLGECDNVMATRKQLRQGECKRIKNTKRTLVR